jgi:hypothetical protein
VVYYFRTFGCIAHVKHTRPLQNKLDDRSSSVIFLGYEQGCKAYRCYDLVTKRIIMSHEVIFDEPGQWHWDDGEDSVDVFEPFIIEYTTEIVQGREYVPASASPAPSHAPSTPPPAVQADTTELMSPPAEHELDLNIDRDDAPLRFRAINSMIGPSSPPGLTRRVLVKELHFTTADEPTTFAEAEQEASWRQAMCDELKSIEDNSTWELTSLPASHKAIGLKWVFKVKRDENDEVVRHKARLVVKGYEQRVGIDFDEVFAPVACIESVRVMLALAVHEHWEVHHMDVKSVFLNGDLKEEVYVTQPSGFVDDDNKHKVFRLRKPLYGLRQAPRAWNTKLDATMVSLGFKKSSFEHGVYTRSRGATRLVIGIYIDDLFITGTGCEEIATFKLEMKNMLQMSDLGLLSYYLRIEVRQGADGIKLCQAAYAGKLLEHTGLSACNPSLTPMEPRLKLSKRSTSSPVNAMEYRRVIGGLRYLLHTRPDLAFAVGYLSRFMEQPVEEHLTGVNRVLRGWHLGSRPPLRQA